MKQMHCFDKSRLKTARKRFKKWLIRQLLKTFISYLNCFVYRSDISYLLAVDSCYISNLLACAEWHLKWENILWKSSWEEEFWKFWYAKQKNWKGQWDLKRRKGKCNLKS